MDDRAVSSTLNYVLSLAIASILVTGLLLAGGTFVDDRRQEVIRNELHVIGQQVAADLERADRLHRAGGSTGSTEVAIQRQFPDRITGVNYRLEVQPGTPDRVALIADSQNVEVTVRVETNTDLAASSAQGGPLDISYDGSANALVVDDA